MIEYKMKLEVTSQERNEGILHNLSDNRIFSNTGIQNEID